MGKEESHFHFRWGKIDDPKSIAELLYQICVDHSANVDSVLSRIIRPARHPAVAASFALIMFSSQEKLSFNRFLSGIEQKRCQSCSVNQFGESRLIVRWLRFHIV